MRGVRRIPLRLGDFQLVLRPHDRDLYMRCRDIWDPIELRIRKSIPKRFEFGGAKKIVIELGPDDRMKVDYLVLLDVGCYHYPDFDVVAFLGSEEHARLEAILKIVEFVMTDLSGRFDAPVPWLWDEIASIRRDYAP